LRSPITLAVFLLILSPAALPLAPAAIQSITSNTVPQARINLNFASLPVTNRDDIQFSHISTNEGLSQTRVAQIIQDDDGFLWFATQYGLNRYDGYKFKVFVSDPTRKNSLGCVYIYSLFKDREGTVWVGCEHGVYRFDKVTETFRHYPIEGDVADGLPVIVSNVSQDHTGALWLSTGNGLYRLDPATGRTTAYRHDPLNPSSLSSNDVRFAAEDSSHRFWVATGVSGVSLEEFDRESGKVVLRIPVTSDRLGLSDVGVAFYEDHFGVFWIIYTTIGPGSGLAVLDRATNTLTRYSIYDRNSRRELAGGVQAVVEDQKKELWFATSEGLLRFNREQRMFYRYRHHPGDPDSLPEDRVISLCADREGNVWAGLHALAPAFFRSGTPSFTPLLRRPSNPNSLGETFVNAIYEDQQGLLWIGTTGALIRIDRESGQYTSYPPPGLALSDDIIAITEDRSGGFWIGSFGGGLSRFDRSSGRYKTYRHHASDPSSLSDDVVSRVLVDSSGAMWLTTWNGLDRFDPVTERFVVYRFDTRSQYFNVTEDHDGSLWIGGSTGLTRFEPNTGRVVRFSHKPNDPGSLSDNLVANVHIDQPGTVWVGTQNGLNKLNRSTGTFAHYYASDGLPVNDISCILEDQAGKLWISTARGMSKFDPLTKTFENFSTAEGLPATDLTGWDACFKAASGEMFFGGFSGGIAFYPEKVGHTAYIPPIVLTDFRLSGNSVEIGPQSILKKSISYESDITLPYRQRVFSITFAALNYLNPAGARYRYKLEGLDGQWNEAGSDRRLATYTTLPAGRYTFRVQGAISGGAWGEPGVKLGITILPPWWATWWFRTLCAVTAVSLLSTLYLLRVRYMTRQYNLRLDARVNERTRIARELHDTLLQSFHGLLLRFQTVADLLPARAVEAKQIVLSAVDQTAQAITEGRDAVQGLRASAIETTDFAEELRTLAESAAAESGNDSVLLCVQAQGAPRALHPIVRDEIYRIGGEALRNAFRHAGATRIQVELRYEARRLQLAIRDDGKGIDAQLVNEERYGGRFGLRGMRERAKLIGGRLEIWSAPKSGTELELTVPASRAYATAPSRRLSLIGERL